MSMTNLMFKRRYVFYDKKREDRWRSDEPSCTLQEFKDESDINNLVARYRQTGSFYDALAVHGKEPRMPSFEDISEIPDYQTALNIIEEGRARFDALPPSIRRIFDNSPELFLAFMSDPKNSDKASELGLLAKKGVQGSQTPVSVKPVPQQAVEASVKASENQ